MSETQTERLARRLNGLLTAILWIVGGGFALMLLVLMVDAIPDSAPDPPVNHVRLCDTNPTYAC